MIIGLVALVVIGFIMYSTASTEIPTNLQGLKYAFIDGPLMKQVGGSISFTILLIVIAFASWVILEIVNFFK